MCFSVDQAASGSRGTEIDNARASCTLDSRLTSRDGQALDSARYQPVNLSPALTPNHRRVIDTGGALRRRGRLRIVWIGPKSVHVPEALLTRIRNRPELARSAVDQRGAVEPSLRR